MSPSVSKKNKKNKIKAKKKHKKSRKKKGEKNIIFKNSEQFFQSLKINYFFWISLLISTFLLTKYNSNKISFFASFISLILSGFVGWWIHYLAHAYDLEKLYDDSTNFLASTLKQNKKVDYVVRTLIYYSFDFHDKMHHDSSINKKPIHILHEMFQNFMMEGGYLIILANYFSMTGLNRAVLCLWGALYASVHNINYIILGCDQHTKHHINPKTNYGIDTLDIFFDTKYDVDNIEHFNHAAINIIIITFLILYFKICL